MALTEQEELQIAKKIIKEIFRERGIPLWGSKRELGTKAKALDVPADKLREFLKPIFLELVEENFGTKNSAKVED